MNSICPVVSKKNPYWIEKHRFYELRHFCLQYNIWIKARNSINYFSSRSIDKVGFSNDSKSITEKAAEQLAYYNERIDMVDICAKKADEELHEYLVYGITNDLCYEKLKVKTDIPCCRNTYYAMYRKFFYILNKMHSLLRALMLFLILGTETIILIK